MALRVHLADDHTMFREGLEALFASSEAIEVVGTSSTGEEAAALVVQSKPDVVITQLDVNLKTAQEILEGIRAASPNSRVVVLTMFDNLRYLKALSRLGIDAYVHKSSSNEELIATIEALSRQQDGGTRWSRCPAACWSGWARGPWRRSRRGRRRSWCSSPAAFPTTR
jgi:DNA-binding NarL/FixJ family response regulator